MNYDDHVRRNKISHFRDHITELEERLARARRQLLIVETIGEDDDWADGTILRVEVGYTRASDQTCMFAWLRDGGRWYSTTSAMSPGKTWMEFIDWLTQDGRDAQEITLMGPESKIL